MIITKNAIRYLVFGFIGTLIALLSALAFLPSSWLGVMLAENTRHKISIGDTSGSIWRGSGTLGWLSDSKDRIRPFFPGKFYWKITPSLWSRHLTITINHQTMLSEPIEVKGSWKQWNLSDSTFIIPAKELSTIGAPFNTIALEGQVQISWKNVNIVFSDDAIEVFGGIKIGLLDITSALSEVKPLGHYNIAFDLKGTTGTIKLTTVKGALILTGMGNTTITGLRFYGTAKARSENDFNNLVNLMNMLGQWQEENGEKFVVLKF